MPDDEGKQTVAEAIVKALEKMVRDCRKSGLLVEAIAMHPDTLTVIQGAWTDSDIPLTTDATLELNDFDVITVEADDGHSDNSQIIH